MADDWLSDHSLSDHSLSNHSLSDDDWLVDLERHTHLVGQRHRRWHGRAWEPVVERAERRLTAVLQAPDLSGPARTDAVADLFDRMRPAVQVALARRDPDRLANLNGVPFDLRARCQRPRIAAARERALAAVRDCADMLEWLRRAPGNQGRPGAAECLIAERLGMAPQHVRGHLAHVREEHRALAKAYGELLEDRVPVFDPEAGVWRPEPRCVVAFHPERRSGIVEVRGRIHATTRDVALIVTGSTNHNANFGRLSAFGDDLAARDGAAGRLVPVMYMAHVPGTSVMDMLDPSYGEAAAPELADFSYALQHELRRAVPPGAASRATVTAMLYSYGAFIGGLARTYGMYVHRYVHLAGVGAGVDSVDEYHPPPGFEDPEEYSMILTNDPVNKLRYGPLLRVGFALGNRFGLDPTTLPGIRRIDPGRYNHLCLSRNLIGQRLEKAPDPHIAYLGRDTEAYDRLFAVMTGAEFERRADGYWVPRSRQTPEPERPVDVTRLLDGVVAASRLLPASADRSRVDPGSAATDPAKAAWRARRTLRWTGWQGRGQG